MSCATGCAEAATYALMARPGVASTCTDGTMSLSVNRLSTLTVLYRIMPAPPAWATARIFPSHTTAPRGQSTILHAGALGHRGTGLGTTVAEPDRALEEPGLGAGSDGRDPRHRGRATDRGRTRTGVAGRAGHENARVRCVQERDVIGAGQRRTAADRVVDDVDTVGHCLVDRRGEVRGVATLVAERLVGDDLGARGDARDLAQRHAEDARVDVRVARGGRGGVRTVALVVTSGVVLVRGLTTHQAVRGEHLAGTDQLVVAGERRVERVLRGVAEVARRVRRRVLEGDGGRGERPVVGEARVLGPDAGVDDADDDARTGVALRPDTAPAGQAEEGGLGVVRARAAGVR